jgi:hypothetical protein
MHTAQLLAADLAGANVDVNEAQKALAYLLARQKPRDFFDYLRTINRHGYTVVRSNRTIGYYRDLQAACERHLDGMEIDEMQQTLGWALRLLRYYKAVPNAEPDRTSEAAKKAQEPAAPRTEARLPQVGEVFRGTIVDDDPPVTLALPTKFQDAQGKTIPVPANANEQVLVVIPPTHKGGGLRTGNARWVEVINVRTVQGTQLLEVKPVKPPQQR